MKDTIIKTIPLNTMRYFSYGDYWDESDNTKQVRVVETGNPDYEFLIALHELIEEKLCEKRGIPEPVIKAFDEAFEAKREPGNDDEPGHDPAAPYRKEHIFAECVERLMAAELGVDWQQYGATLDAL
jgi:hypothetical protein